MDKKRINTFVINLKARSDRKVHILNEFSTKSEFQLSIFEAIENPIGGIGLWNSIRLIIEQSLDDLNDYILICEDDHQFTNFYEYEELLHHIEKAKEFGADILLGGVSSVNSLFKVSDNLLWVEGFTGTQFVIVFKKFFCKILESIFLPNESADFKFTALTAKQFLIFPFISIQKEFGYSDITSTNNDKGVLDDLFIKCSNAIEFVLSQHEFYRVNKPTLHDYGSFSELSLPTYLIVSDVLGNSIDIKEFENKNEFDLNLVATSLEEDTNQRLWQNIKKVIEMGVKNDDDMLIFCDYAHVFTEKYSKFELIENIFEGHSQGLDLLLGSTNGGFRHSFPVGSKRFWINQSRSSHFIIFYKKFFKVILSAVYNGEVKVETFLSELTNNKMVIHPFISAQKEFYVVNIDENSGKALEQFEYSSKRLTIVQKFYKQYYISAS